MNIHNCMFNTQILLYHLMHRFPVIEPQFKLCTNLGVVYYCEKALHCNATCVINLKVDPTFLAAWDLILLSNLPKPCTLLCTLDNRQFTLQYSTCRLIKRTGVCECSFLVGPYYLAQIILTCQCNAATMDGLLRIYYAFSKVLSGYLKAYHWFHPNQKYNNLWCYWLRIFNLMMLKYQKINWTEGNWTRILAEFMVNSNKH